ncbi:MAG: hypothetical protein ACNA8L_06640 [Luteolibacter sp.]|jgi:hypothetical protein
MNARFFFTIVSGCLILATSAPAQTPQQPGVPNDTVTDTVSRNPFWQASVGGGHYMVRLDRIASISRHRYLLDGAVIVDEVTVDTAGQALARFYHLAPITDAVGNDSVARIAGRGREILEQAAGRANSDIQNMVVKKYPDTTHARTIEYRVETAEQLTALYDSLRTAWESGRGREMTIQQR